MKGEKGELELEFDEKELLKKGYLKVWMLFEVQSNSFDVTKKALAKHIATMKKTYDVNVLEENFTGIDEVEAGAEHKARNINMLFSQICEMTFMLKKYETLVEMVINYGPTSVEIIAPEKITLDMREAQSSLMAVAEMMHKFASHGVGGIVIKT